MNDTYLLRLCPEMQLNNQQNESSCSSMHSTFNKDKEAIRKKIYAILPMFSKSALKSKYNLETNWLISNETML